MDYSYEEIRRLEGRIEMALLGARLSAWESKFLTAMRNRIQKYGSHARFTPKQADTIDLILSRKKIPRGAGVVPTSAVHSTRSSPRGPKPLTFPSWIALALARDFIRTFAAVLALSVVIIGYAVLG